MNRAFSQCVAGPGGREPESRIPGPARPQSACPPPFRLAAARALPGACARQPRPESLRHRGSGRACAAAAGPWWPPALTRVSRVPPRLRRRVRSLAGPGPRETPSRQGLAASLSRPGCPAWSCVRHGARLRLLPCPPAGPPPAAAACTTQPPPSRLPCAAPRPPGLTGSGDRGRSRGGGPERTAIGVRGGGAGKPPPPSPRSPEARDGPGNLPPARGGRRPGWPSAAAPLAGRYLPASRGPCPGAQPSRAARRIRRRVLQPPPPPGHLRRPGSRHFGPVEWADLGRGAPGPGETSRRRGASAAPARTQPELARDAAAPSHVPPLRGTDPGRVEQPRDAQKWARLREPRRALTPAPARRRAA
ncbi:basic proline-rich protein-like [Marmota monax]|uniref:basic proline-rich protein-like n=1 Tax=Marmota monax TaxID=9995 RepID=UPI0026F33F72|nr:basic proline-rich protein-like [Marmota monax]